MSDYMGLDKEDAKKRVDPSLSYALGVGSFTPYEVARAYSAIANDGVAVKPIAILKVKDRKGAIIDDFEQSRDQDPNNRKPVMDVGTAFLMQSMLYDVLYHGTGALAAADANFSLTAGGKTGTTDYWKDAWFSGFTKNLVTVVWFGFDGQNKSLGKDRTGAVVATPVWMRYMKEALKDVPDIPFTPPGDVVSASVCATSGLLPTQYCPHVISEYFLRNTVPVKKCNIHTAEGSGSEEDELKSFTNEINFKDLELGLESPTSTPKGKSSSKKSKSTDLSGDNSDFNIDDKLNIKSGL
jgi:penicillin-binding protein 1A